MNEARELLIEIVAEWRAALRRTGKEVGAW